MSLPGRRTADVRRQSPRRIGQGAAMGPQVVVNGLNGATGAYLVPPLTPHQVSEAAQSAATDADHLGELRWWHRHVVEASYGPRYGIDPADLGQAGWGVIFAAGADPALREALSPLLAHRRSLAAAVVERRYREYTGPDAYRPGESKTDFLARHGAAPGPADPD